MRIEKSMLLRVCPSYPKDKIDADISTFNL